MEMRQLRSLIAVVDKGSFTRAAESLYLSQPTISAHIRQLEEEFGAELLQRNTRSVCLTDKGRELYACGRRMLELYDELQETWELQEKILRIGASTVPAAYILPGFLEQYRLAHPDTMIRFRQNDSAGVLQDLRDRVIDVGFVGTEVSESGVLCRKVAEDELVLITPADPPHDDMSPGDLLAEPFIMREAGSGSRSTVERYLNAVGADSENLNVCASVSDQETIKALVSHGMGVSILSRRSAKQWADDGRLRIRELLQDRSGRAINLVVLKENMNRPRIREFLEAAENM